MDAEVPHLTLAIVETYATLYTSHPAFRNGVTGEARIRMLQGVATWVDAGENKPDHPINLAGVAMGNITDIQDDNILDPTAQDARSGVARRAMGVFSWEPIDTTLSDLSEGGLVDVVLQAETLNTAGDEFPTDDEARGLDDNSRAVVAAFLGDGMIYVKSAGNLNIIPGRGRAAGDEVSAPGAAATALAVGDLNAEDDTARDMQQEPSLAGRSSRGTTRDDRTYPSLVAPGWGCGVPYSALPLFAGPFYDRFNGSSAASATVAGCVVLFKHWYLARLPVYANIPGRVMSNILNMADGYVGGALAAPAEGWGLGRFRLRLYDEGGMSGDWARATTRVDLEHGEAEVLDLGSVAIDGTTRGFLGGGGVPAGATRLRVTVWWLEPNTGPGEEKAAIEATLSYTGADGFTLWSSAESGRDNVIRLQFESGTWTTVPAGQVLLTLTGSVPEAVRYIEGARRTLYVSWFWESGRDLSLISSIAGTPGEAAAGLGSLAAESLADRLDPAGPSTPVVDEVPLSREAAVRLIDAVERKIGAFILVPRELSGRVVPPEVTPGPLGRQSPR